jgi:sirohydrochlorin cobaltochelatase
MGTAATQAGTGVVLVGHGAVARDCPRELVTRLKSLEAQRRSTGGPPTAEERELDTRIRQWPRTPQNDPYRRGLEALAARLRPRLSGARVMLAYNEFCAPTVEAAIEALIADGVTDISVVPSMLTPGGTHSEVDIPQALAPLRARHPQVTIRYAWPVDLDLIADMLSRHLGRRVDRGQPASTPGG